jgi:hypothetical protein
MSFLPGTPTKSCLSPLRRCAVRHVLLLLLMFWLMASASGGSLAWAQNIQISPSAISLSVAQGGTASGTLTLKKSGSAQHTYFISANQSWIWLNPPYGSTQTIGAETDVLTVTVNTASMGLSAGTYSGLVYIGESGPGGSTMWRIPVTATVTASGTTPRPIGSATTPPPPPSTTPQPPSTQPPPSATPPPASAPPPPPVGSLAPMLKAFPGALSLSAPKGANPSGVFNLQKSSSHQSVYGISTNQSWILLNPPYGSTQTITTETDPIRVTVNTASLNVGTHTAVVYITESGPNGSNMLRIPVTATVTAGGGGPSPVGSATTPPPPPPPSGTGTGTVTVMWSANNEADLQGYRVYVGTSSGARSQTFDVGNVTSTRLTLPRGSTYFFVVTAYDKSGNESYPSGELSKSVF